MADFYPEHPIGHRISFALQGVAYAVALICAGGTALADEPPQRVSDTNYGMAIYEYHQGNFFQALTRLNLASSEGGISGHGDHPLLVEGGLMMGYGMTREARALFLRLLDESDVSEENRNQAWFYLGKVFWLEEDAEASSDALARVDGDLLENTDKALYQEWLYLKGQWLVEQNEAPEDGESLDDILRALPEWSPWSWYLRYNRALQSLAAGDLQTAVDSLSTLIEQAGPEEGLPPETAEELGALEQQARLTLGRLHLDQGDTKQAMVVLDDIPLDGLFSDQALFHYAVAASRQGQHDLALLALDTLESRPLLRPWLQQAPYARALVIEQMDQPKAALDAYRKAAEQYVELDEHLASEQSDLTESRLLEALIFIREGGSEPGSAEPSLGESAILTDSYGRVQVRPQDFGLAELLAGEAFQLVLRDLHELYRLENALNRWHEELASFDEMLETRRNRREALIRETRDALASLDADKWVAQQREFRRKIEQAASEGAAFKQLRELDGAIETFLSQRQLMEQEMASNVRLDEYANRILQKREELDQLDQRLGQALDQSRQDLMALVESELASQRRDINAYLRASRHAQARLADRLFLKAREPAATESPEEQSTESEDIETRSIEAESMEMESSEMENADE